MIEIPQDRNGAKLLRTTREDIHYRCIDRRLEMRFSRVSLKTEALRTAKGADEMAFALRMCTVPLFLILICETATAGAQQVPADLAPTTFDVVSIRENKSGQHGSNYGFTADGFSMTNLPLSQFVMFAFRVKSPKFISGLPGWTGSAHFDIQAKMDEDKLAALKRLPAAEGVGHRYIMLQQILFDRFDLNIHHTKKEFPAYALVPDKGPSKLTEAGNEPDIKSAGTRDGELSLRASPMSLVVLALSHYLDREVVDQTGLTGRYDISLKWVPQTTLDQGVGVPTGVPGSIFAAIREQLGLQLVPTHPIEADTIVVDDIRMPTEN